MALSTPPVALPHDSDAWKELLAVYRNHLTELLGLAKKCGAHTNEEDVVQEAIIGALASSDLKTRSQGGNPLAYVKQAIRNRVRDVQRHDRIVNDFASALRQARDRSGDVTESVLPMVIALRRAIEELSPEDRELLFAALERGGLTAYAERHNLSKSWVSEKLDDLQAWLRERLDGVKALVPWVFPQWWRDRARDDRSTTSASAPTNGAPAIVLKVALAVAAVALLARVDNCQGRHSDVAANAPNGPPAAPYASPNPARVKSAIEQVPDDASTWGPFPTSLHELSPTARQLSDGFAPAALQGSVEPTTTPNACQTELTRSMRELRDVEKDVRRCLNELKTGIYTSEPVTADPRSGFRLLKKSGGTASETLLFSLHTQTFSCESSNRQLVCIRPSPGVVPTIGMVFTGVDLANADLAKADTSWKDPNHRIDEWAIPFVASDAIVCLDRQTLGSTHHDIEMFVFKDGPSARNGGYGRSATFDRSKYPASMKGMDGIVAWEVRVPRALSVRLPLGSVVHAQLGSMDWVEFNDEGSEQRTSANSRTTFEDGCLVTAAVTDYKFARPMPAK